MVAGVQKNVSAFSIIGGAFKIFSKHPVLVVPLLPVFVAVLLLDVALIGAVMVDIPGIVLLAAFLVLLTAVAYVLMLSFSVSSAMLKQFDSGKPISLGEAMGEGLSKASLKLIPVTVVWVSTVVILVIIESMINRLTKGKGAAILDQITSGIATALRMMAFMMVSIFVFEGLGFMKAFGRMKEVLGNQAMNFISGVVLMRLVSFLVGVGLVLLVTVLGGLGVLLLPVYLAVAGVVWVASMYMEQMFVTAMYAYTMNPNGNLAKEFIEETLHYAPQPVAV